MGCTLTLRLLGGLFASAMILSCGFDGGYPPELGDKELAWFLSEIDPEELESVGVYRNEWSPRAIGELTSSCERHFLKALSELKSFQDRPEGQSTIMFGANATLRSGEQFEAQIVSYAGDPQQWFVAVFHHGGFGSLFKGEALVEWASSLQERCIAVSSSERRAQPDKNAVARLGGAMHSGRLEG